MSLFHKCPHCGKYSITLDALQFHITYAHGMQPATPAPAKVDGGDPHGVHTCHLGNGTTPDDQCKPCRHTKHLKMLRLLVEQGDLTDFFYDKEHHLPQRNHWKMLMKPEDDARWRGNLDAQVGTLMRLYGGLLDDGAGYGE